MRGEASVRVSEKKGSYKVYEDKRDERRRTRYQLLVGSGSEIRSPQIPLGDASFFLCVEMRSRLEGEAFQMEDDDDDSP